MMIMMMSIHSHAWGHIISMCPPHVTLRAGEGCSCMHAMTSQACNRLTCMCAGEGCNPKDPPPSLYAEFPQLQPGVHYVSSKTGLGCDALVRAVVALALKQPRMGERLPTSWIQLRKQVRDHRALFGCASHAWYDRCAQRTSRRHTAMSTALARRTFRSERTCRPSCGLAILLRDLQLAPKHRQEMHWVGCILPSSDLRRLCAPPPPPAPHICIQLHEAQAAKRAEEEPVMAMEEYRRLAVEGCGLAPEAVDLATVLFSDFGDLLHFRSVPGLDQQIILRPQWVADVMSKVRLGSQTVG